MNDEWNAIDLSPSASITLSPRSCTRLDVVRLLFYKMKSKRARSIYGTLSVCGFVNKSYAPGACTSVDAIRLLFDSYSKKGKREKTCTREQPIISAPQENQDRPCMNMRDALHDILLQKQNVSSINSATCISAECKSSWGSRALHGLRGHT